MADSSRYCAFYWQVWFLRFSHDGTKLATGSKDSTAILWDVSVSGSCLLLPVKSNPLSTNRCLSLYSSAFRSNPNIIGKSHTCENCDFCNVFVCFVVDEMVVCSTVLRCLRINGLSSSMGFPFFLLFLNPWAKGSCIITCPPYCIPTLCVEVKIHNPALLRPRSHLMPEHGARVRFSLGTNVNTFFSSTHARIRARAHLFFKYPRQNSRARVQGRDLVLGH